MQASPIEDIVPRGRYPLAAPRDQPAAARQRAIIAAAIGNVLEWYDFFVYALLAMTMAKLFFPAESEFTSLLLSLATFGVALLMRPFGAIAFGIYADRKGRKAALCLTMSLMALGTGVIAVAPTSATIGIWAPILVVAARLLQGFACGGESGAAVTLLAEASPDHRRGFYTSWYAAGQKLGFVLAALITMAITLVLTPAQIEAGGWRLPFLFGLLIAPVALYIRLKVEEPELFLRTRAESQPVKSPNAIWRQRGPILVGLGVSAVYVMSGYVIFLYMPTFAVRELGLSFTGALLSTILANCISMVCTPFAAAWSDRVGRRPVLQLATVGFLLLTYPGYAIITAWPTLTSLALVQCCLGVLTAMYFGPCISVFAELFPTRVRSTSVALTINVMVIFGGSAPAFSTWLISATADPRAPALIVIGASLLSGFALFWVKDNHRQPLR